MTPWASDLIKRGWTQDQAAEADERAAIREYDGGQRRASAEARTLLELRERHSRLKQPARPADKDT